MASRNRSPFAVFVTILLLLAASCPLHAASLSVGGGTLVYSYTTSTGQCGPPGYGTLTTYAYTVSTFTSASGAVTTFNTSGGAYYAWNGNCVSGVPSGPEPPSGVPLNGPTFTITFYPGAGYASATYTNNLITPTISITSSGTPSTYGNSVTFTATVTAADTNTVTFSNGSTTLGTVTPNGGTATFATSSLPVGSNSITATIAAGGSYASATSSAMTQVVNQVTPAIALSTSGTPSSYGGSVTFTVTVPSADTNTVTFSNGSTTLGTATPSGGTATFATGSLPVGSNSITATIAAGGNYTAATSSTITQVVSQATPSITLATSGTPSTYGNSVTFTATVTAADTNTVTFSNGSTTLGTATPSGGTATFATSSLSVGSDSITATIAAGGNYTSASSSAITQVVNSITPAISLATSGTPSSYGASVTFTATVTAADTNIVTFKNGSTTLGTATPSGGTATLATSSLPVGSDGITATIAAGGNYGSATSSTITQVVNGITPTITLATSGTPSTYGNSVTFTATVTAADTNTVTFLNGSTTLGTATPSGGTATLATSSLPVGSDGITATIAAGGNYGSATSSTITQVVNGITPTITLATSGTPSTYGNSVTFTATVTATDTNTVTFLNGSTTLGTATPSGGRAVLATSSLPAGSDGITATIAAGGNYAGATSAAITQVVNQATPTISINNIPGNAYYGSSFTVAYSYSGNGSPSESVASSTTSVCTVSGNTVTFTGLGTCTLTASAGATANYTAATGSAQSFTVIQASPTLTLTTSTSQSNYGDQVTFTATMTGGVSGTVTFYANGTTIGTASLSGSTASLVTSHLFPGSAKITASWPGNMYYQPVTSAAITQTVTIHDTITTIAGNGTMGYAGDNGPATSAELTDPYWVALGTNSNLYICDSNNYRIRKVTAATGIITTVAGNGTQGYSGDGGAATSAEINYCYGVAVDSTGNLYINDLSNCRVRKVSTSGIITTVAGNGTCGMTGVGGSATSAEIYPFGIAVDGSGNLYFGNTSSYPGVMQKVSTSGIITTIPNLTAVTPVVDAAGNLYVYSNGAINKYSSITGTSLGTIAGNGTAGYSGDGGPATSAEVNSGPTWVDASGNLYLNGGTRKVNAGTGIISTVAAVGGGEGCIEEANSAGDGCLSIDGIFGGGPGNHAVDSQGNIYVADFYGRRVRLVAPFPSTETQASGVSAVSCSPSSITFNTSATCTASVSAGTSGNVDFAYVNSSTNAITYGGVIALQGGQASDQAPILAAGTYNVVATYSGGGSYQPSVGTSTTPLTASKAMPVLSWATPGPIYYGTALGAGQLDAKSSVPGVFVYTPSAGTVLGVGSHTLSATFSPSDATDYAAPPAITTSITVNQTTPAVKWSNPSSIQYGTALTSAQLNATANVPGTFAYNPALGAVLAIGTQTLSVVFTPTSSPYNTSNTPVNASVQLVVTGDIPVITSILPSPALPGSTVTIAGQNFAASQGQSTVTFNGVTATASAWSDQSITVTVPPGAKTGNVVVTVAGVQSNAFLFMVPIACGQ